MNFPRQLLRALASLLGEPRVIYDRKGLSPYLSRWYFLGGPRDDEGNSGPKVVGPVELSPRARFHALVARLPVNLYLHRFHRGDDDEALHNHPWRWAVSLVLAGGYEEERRTCGHCSHVERRAVRPWSVNVLRTDSFHRVDLLEHDSWSLFLAGPKEASWGFWDRVSGTSWPWRDFIALVRGPGWETTGVGDGKQKRTATGTNGGPA